MHISVLHPGISAIIVVPGLKVVAWDVFGWGVNGACPLNQTHPK